MKIATALSSTLLASALYASPQFLITHNLTAVDSNAYIDGTIASAHPTKANSNGKVLWGLVKMACFSHITNNICTALIKMETNTNHPVTIGSVNMNIVTGDITPAYISNNGYSITVNGPGEVSLSKVQ